MRRRDPRTPRIDPIVLPDLRDGVAADLVGGARLDGLRIAGAAILGEDLTDLFLDECVLEHVALDDCRLDGARVADCVLDGVTATSLRAHRSAWRDVRITGSRLGAAEWLEADLTRVEAVGCRIDFLSIADGRLSDVRFTDCTIGDLDLRGTAAERVAFSGCRVRELSLADATLRQVDLRGAELERIDGVRALAGAVVSEEQLLRLAPLLAAELGIVVE